MFSLFPRKSAGDLLFRETVQTQYLKKKKKVHKTSVASSKHFSNPPPILKLLSVCFLARAVRCYSLATWQGLFREDSRARFANPSDFEHRNRSRTHGRPPAVRKRDSNTVPGPQVPRGCWAREAPTRKEASRGPWVGGWWHGRGGVWAGAHGGAARADAWRRGTVPGWGKVGPPRGCSPRGRAGSVWLEGVPCSPFAHARLRFFLGPQDQRARDDRPRTHGRAVAAARE